MASLGLLASYGDSSDSDSENVDNFQGTSNDDEKDDTKKSDGPIDFFNVTEDASSDSDDDNSPVNKPIENNPPPIKNQEKLPAPDLSSFERTSSCNSVFGNPFQEEELAKNMALEKHVKMTNFVPEDGSKKRKIKQICYKFMKGNCRFGDKCRFYHSVPPGSIPGGEQGKVTKKVYTNMASISIKEDIAGTNDPVDEDSYMSNIKKRKRPGLTNSLLPPKKSLQNYGKQRREEQPWLFPKK